MYLSSADLMTRNMDKRIEIAWPILNPVLREQVLGYLDISWSDTAKLRELLADGSYTPLGFFAKADERGEVALFDSQEYLISEAQRMRLAAAELAARHEAERDEERRLVFPLGRVAEVAPEAPEVVTEEESEYVPHEEARETEEPVVEPAAQSMADAVAGRSSDVVGEALAALRHASRGAEAPEAAVSADVPAEAASESAILAEAAGESDTPVEPAADVDASAAPAAAVRSAAETLAVAAGASAASVLQSAGAALEAVPAPAPAPAAAPTPADASLEPDPFAPAAEIVDPTSPSAATGREPMPTPCVTADIVPAPPKKLGFFGRLLKLLFG